MPKILDLSKKKPALPIKLPDDTLIRVYTPSKAMLEEFISIGAQIDRASDDADALNQLYDVTARLLSNNAGGRKLSTKEVSEMLDVGDVIVFFRAYTEFITELSKEKN